MTTRKATQPRTRRSAAARTKCRKRVRWAEIARCGLQTSTIKPTVKKTRAARWTLAFSRWRNWKSG
eukprot:3489604-Lingulodinium_polyedra.AAC.1